MYEYRQVLLPSIACACMCMCDYSDSPINIHILSLRGIAVTGNDGAPVN